MSSQKDIESVKLQLSTLLKGTEPPYADRTLHGYIRDSSTFLSMYAERRGISIVHALPDFLRDGSAQQLIDEYKQQSFAAGLAVNTVNRRLLALKAIVCAARREGLCEFDVEAKTEKTIAPNVKKDSPSIDDMAKAMAYLFARKDTKKGARDYAALRLLWVLGMRRTELISLNVGDFDYANHKLYAISKIDGNRYPLHLDTETAKALHQMLLLQLPNRKELTEPGGNVAPLFISLEMGSRAYPSPRLSGDGLYKLLLDSFHRSCGMSRSIRLESVRALAAQTVKDYFTGTTKRMAVETFTRCYYRGRVYSEECQLRAARMLSERIHEAVCEHLKNAGYSGEYPSTEDPVYVGDIA